MEWLLTQTIEAGKLAGTVKSSDLKRVTVDTTVMEKSIAHPTDARLYETARRKLVGLAREAGIEPPRVYRRVKLSKDEPYDTKKAYPVLYCGPLARTHGLGFQAGSERGSPWKTKEVSHGHSSSVAIGLFE